MSAARQRRRVYDALAISIARHSALPTVITHARPSFFTLSVRWQRHLIAGKLQELYVTPRIARRVTRYWPRDFAALTSEKAAVNAGAETLGDNKK